MNKKGFLLGEETLKIVLAVIAISFLIYFLAALYLTNADKDKRIKAEETLEKISTEVRNLQLKTSSVDAINPEGWYLFGFVGGSSKPNSCAGENCLCICNDKWFANFNSRQLKECDEKGACLIIPGLQEFEKIKIQKGGLTSIEINKQGELVQIVEK
ncbi:hypothetical protein ACFLZJ_00090 [Nanoarchaeota archaeon]